MTGQQLKNSILQMAVQGKLVPQDPNDEPASVLLERIRKEKEQLIKDGKIKKEKNPSIIFRGADNLPYEKVGNNEPVCIADEVPFDIPDSWEWVRIKNCCMDIFSGKSPKYEKSETEFHIIGQAANQNAGIDYSQCKYTNIEFWETMDEKYFLKEYDVLLNTLGNGTLGRSGIVTELPYPVLTDGHMFVFRTTSEIMSWYIFLYLQYRKNEIEKSANGSTNQTFLNLSKTIEWLVPLPPIDEQFRIIAKYKTILPIIDKYSKSYESCQKLNSSFPELLKKSILQEAVQGKLVPQDPNDEPASVLLERIRAEKQALIKAGKIKKDKHESVIFRRDNSHYEKLNGIERCIDDEIPFEIPNNWEWITLKMVAISSLGKTLDKAKNQGEFKPYLCSINVYWSGINLSTVKEARFEKDELSKYCLKEGDLLICEGGDVGRSAIWRDNREMYYQNALHRVRFFGGISPDYFHMILECYKNNKILEENSKGMTIKHLVQSSLNSIYFPLPPLKEQHRIVATYKSILPALEQL